MTHPPPQPSHPSPFHPTLLSHPPPPTLIFYVNQVKGSIELEASMAFEDRLITETADKRNELEAYIYSMRDKLDGIYKPYGTEAEKSHMQVGPIAIHSHLPLG